MAAKSVHVEYVAAGSYMHIDAGSVESLELLRPLQLQPGGGGCTAKKKAGSLFGYESEQRSRHCRTALSGPHYMLSEGSTCDEGEAHSGGSYYKIC